MGVVFLITVYLILLVWNVRSLWDTIPSDAKAWHEAELEALTAAVNRLVEESPDTSNESQQADEVPRLAREEWQALLDQAVWQNSSLLLLRRLTVMAPLCGVMLTAIAFMTTDFDQIFTTTVSGRPQMKMGVLWPLFLGVLSGAGLAVFNHFMVQTWTTGAVRARHQDLTRQLRALLRHDEPTGQVGDIADTLRTLKTSLKGFRTAVEEEIQRLKEKAQADMEEVKARAGKSIESLDAAVGELTKKLNTTGDKCTAAGEKLETTANSLNAKFDTAATSVGESLKGVKGQLDAVSSTIKTSGETYSTAATNMKTETEKASLTLTAAANSVDKSTTAMTTAADAWKTEAEKALNELRQLAKTPARPAHAPHRSEQDLQHSPEVPIEFARAVVVEPDVVRGGHAPAPPAPPPVGRPVPRGAPANAHKPAPPPAVKVAPKTESVWERVKGGIFGRKKSPK